ncbi:MAG: hypothetical protein V4736_14995 [Bdellovibrionota bacterium]
MPFNDDDFKNLLKPLKDIKPSEAEMSKWQNSVMVRARTGIVAQAGGSRGKWAAQLVAAMLVGVLIGAALFKNTNPEMKSELFAQISSGDATFERSHANLD